MCRSSVLDRSAGLDASVPHYFDVRAPKPAIGRGVGPASAVFAEKVAFDPDGKTLPGARQYHRHGTMSSQAR